MANGPTYEEILKHSITVKINCVVSCGVPERLISEKIISLTNGIKRIAVIMNSK